MNCLCLRQAVTVIYQKQRQLIIPFIWGILVGIAITTLLFQQHLLPSSSESWLSVQTDGSYNMFKPTIYRLNRRKINDVKVLSKSEFGYHELHLNAQNKSVLHMIDSHGKNRIYVGVITAEKYLGSRSTGVNKTWGQQVDKIEFFAQFGSKEKYKIPVVNLEKASDKEYPPQKKAFEMLKYMCSHHLDDFEWFVRADDDVYIRVEKLRNFLSGIDSNKAIYMGQPGHGIPEVRMRLGLRGHNFCMGGPGVIFSRKAMKALCPHIDGCMREVVSNEEDVEIGRCVTNHLQIECTHAWESVNLYYHAYQEEYGEEQPFLGNLFDNKHVEPAITLHHLKLPRIMHLVHRHFSALILRATSQNLLRLRSDLRKFDEKLSAFDRRHFFLHKNIPSTSKNMRLKQLVPWKTFTTRSLYSNDPNHVKRDVTNDVLVDLKQVAESAIDTCHNASALLSDSFAFSHVTDGALRTDFNRGTDYHVDVIFEDMKLRQQAQVRRVHLFRPGSNPGVSGMRKLSLHEGGSLFVVVVAVEQSKPHQFEIFMRNFFEPIFLAGEQSRTTRLIVSSVFADPSLQTWSLHPPIDEVLKVYQARYPTAVLVSTPPSATYEPPRTIEEAQACGIVHAHVLTLDVDPGRVVLLLTSSNVTLSSDVAQQCSSRTFASSSLSDPDQHVPAQIYHPLPFQVDSSAVLGPWPTAVLPQAAGLRPGTGVVSVALLKPHIGFWRGNEAPLLCGRLETLYQPAATATTRQNPTQGFFSLLHQLAINRNLTIFRAPDRSFSVLPVR